MCVFLVLVCFVWFANAGAFVWKSLQQRRAKEAKRAGFEGEEECKID